VPVLGPNTYFTTIGVNYVLASKAGAAAENAENLKRIKYRPRQRVQLCTIWRRDPRSVGSQCAKVICGNRELRIYF
jgi:hypothetical protein